MNAIDKNIRQHLARENERSELRPFDQQQHAQAIVGAPQRDPESAELVPHGQNVQNDIDRKKCDSGQPKLRSDQIRDAICPRGSQRQFSAVQCRSPILSVKGGC